jgi:hypothetical protein
MKIEFTLWAKVAIHRFLLETTAQKFVRLAIPMMSKEYPPKVGSVRSTQQSHSWAPLASLPADLMLKDTNFFGHFEGENRRNSARR